MASELEYKVEGSLPEQSALNDELRDAASGISVRERLSQLMSTGLSEVQKFVNDHDPTYIQAALKAYQEAVGDIQINEHLFLWAKAQALHTSFIYLRGTDDINCAIDTYEEAINSTPEIFRRLPDMLHDQSLAYRIRAVLAKSSTDFAKAIAAQREAVFFTDKDDKVLLERLLELGKWLIDILESSLDMKYITEGIEVTNRAIGLMPAPSPKAINIQGNFFYKKFKLTDKLEDINQAIQHQENALDKCDEPENRFRFARDLVISLSLKFSRTGDMDCLNKALLISKTELENIPCNHPLYSAGLHAMGELFRKRSDVSNSPEDISRAVSLFQQAVSCIDKNDTSYPGYLNSLGQAYFDKYKATSDIGYLLNSVDIKQKAVNLTPENDPSLPGRLNDLANSLHEKFLDVGDFNDIHLAIKLQQQAITSTPESHSELLLYLNGLGSFLTSRYRATNNVVDLDEAVAVQNKIIQLTPEDHAGLPDSLSNSGSTLLTRYEMSKKIKDLDDGIAALQRAVKLTPQGHARLASRLNNLSIGLKIKYESTDNTEMKYLEDAINAIRKSVDITPYTHANLHLRLVNLGNMLNERFQKTKDPDDIVRCISCQEKALSLTTDSHATRTGIILSLGYAYKLLYECNSHESDKALATKYFSEAALSPSGIPIIKLQACQEWADMCIQSDSLQALEAYTVAYKLIPQIIQLGQRMENRYYNIQAISDLAGKAAATAISLGKLEIAIEWLEQGRSIIWSQLGALHVPLGDLARIDGNLAVEFKELSEKLGEISPEERDGNNEISNSQRLGFQEKAYSYHSLAEKWHELLQKIRSITGFEEFLKPLSFFKIVSGIPAEGAVVILNVDKMRCDALIMDRGSKNVIHVPLVNLTYDKAEQLQKHLHELLTKKNLLQNNVRAGRKLESRGSAMSPIEAILTPIWFDVVKPVLNALRLSATDNPPRIWWCPTGPLSFLPIHAAGLYKAGVKLPGMVVSDYVISSYAPTLTALIRPTRQDTQGNSFCGILAISQPNTPGLPPIPGTTEEVTKVAEIFQSAKIKSTVLDDKAATLERVIEAIQMHSWIHLACHATQHPVEPLRSAFHFYDGQLDLWELMRRSIPGADFAFLSACQTAVGYDILPDEAIHLAAGMHWLLLTFIVR